VPFKQAGGHLSSLPFVVDDLGSWQTALIVRNACSAATSQCNTLYHLAEAIAKLLNAREDTVPLPLARTATAGSIAAISCQSDRFVSLPGKIADYHLQR